MSRRSLDIVVRHIREIANLPEDADCTDAHLLERFVTSKDEAAFEVLVRRHGHLVRAVCRHVLRCEEDVNDAVQATLLVLARKAGSIRKRMALASWLHGVAFRTALNARKIATRRKFYEKQGRQRIPEEPASAAALHELQALLDEEVERLPDKLRAPFVLCCLEGLSKGEAARELGWKEGTVSGRVAEARERLRTRLARRGVLLSTALCATALAADNAAAVPAATVRVALAFAGGQTSNIRAAAVNLAKVTAGYLEVNYLRVGLVSLLLTCISVAGIGLTLPKRENDGEKATQIAASARPQPETPAAQMQVLADILGDPLPPGAIARIGSSRLWHGNQIYDLAYTPDGRILAACDGRSIRLWDTATGKDVGQFQAKNTELMMRVAISANSELLAASTKENLLIWRLRPGSEQAVRRLPVMEKDNEAVAFSPDGKILASMGKSQVIHIWDVDTWLEVRQFRSNGGKTGWVLLLAFLPDGTTVCAGYGDGTDATVRTWDVSAGKLLGRLDPKGKHLRWMALSPDGKTLATVEGNDNEIRLWKLENGKEISRFVGPEYSCFCMVFSPDNRTLATGGGSDHSVRFFDKETGVQHNKWSVPQAISRLAFSPDGQRLAVGGHWIRFRDPATGKEVMNVPGHQEGIRSLLFIGDGKTLVTGSWNGTVGFWDAATGKARGNLRAPPDGVVPLPGYALIPAFTADAKLVAVVDEKDRMTIWNPAAGKEVRRLGGPRAHIFWSVFSPDGKLLATPHKDGRVRLWEVATGKQLWQTSDALDYIEPQAFSPDNKIVAISTLQMGIVLFDVSTGKELRSFGGRSMCLAFSPDGRLLASGHLDPSMAEGGPSRQHSALLRVWDIVTGREVRTFNGPKSDVLAIAFSPDGRTVATGIRAATGIIQLWEVATGQERRRFEGHGSLGMVQALAFSPDGKLLASGSDDHTSLVWDMSGLKRKKQHAIRLDVDQLDKLWNDLADKDAARAYQAIWSFLASPQESVPFLKERLVPIPQAEGQRYAQLVTELDDDHFQVRERATRELEKAGVMIEPLLRQKLTGKCSLELRQRLEALLGRLKETEIGAEQLRMLRIVEVLEQIGTLQAGQVLRALAGGAPEARLTEEAKASLERLATRAPVTR